MEHGMRSRNQHARHSCAHVRRFIPRRGCPLCEPGQSLQTTVWERASGVFGFPARQLQQGRLRVSRLPSKSLSPAKTRSSATASPSRRSVLAVRRPLLELLMPRRHQSARHPAALLNQAAVRTRGPVVGDGDRVLDVRREAASAVTTVQPSSRTRLGAAGVQHGLDGQHHPRPQAQAAAGLAVVRHRGGSCMARPIPWPTKSRTTAKPRLSRGPRWRRRCRRGGPRDALAMARSRHSRVAASSARAGALMTPTATVRAASAQ